MGQRQVLSPKLTMLSTLGDYAMRFAEALVWLWKHHISTSSRLSSEDGHLKEIEIYKRPNKALQNGGQYIEISQSISRHHLISHRFFRQAFLPCIRFGVPVNAMKTTDFFPAFLVLAVAATATATAAPLPVDKSNQVVQAAPFAGSRNINDGVGRGDGQYIFCRGDCSVTRGWPRQDI